MEIKVSRSVPVNIITTMSHLHTSEKLYAASFEAALSQSKVLYFFILFYKRQFSNNNFCLFIKFYNFHIILIPFIKFCTILHGKTL